MPEWRIDDSRSRPSTGSWLRLGESPGYRDLDVSGEDLREPVVRYEWSRPGDMVHVDVKKLGRIPPDGGHRVHGRTSAQYRDHEASQDE